ncbi:CARDB domain-containing protein [Phnomibacter sp. MR]|uniref:CARDB domain-containing protein n=1 Tax=Phnomibacter sp. MR TaxID=3042318 RepID=UPI003A807B9A
MKKCVLLLIMLSCIWRANAQDPAYPAVPAARPLITAAEYFIDADPGVGNATAITVSAATDVANLVFAANTNGLSNGVHRLFVRTKAADGHWGVTQQSDFLYDFNPAYPGATAALFNITAAEYYVDTDPGFGNGTAITITPGTNLSNVATSVNTTGLSNGIHRVYIRVKNSAGHWSLTHVGEFLVDADPAYTSAPVLVPVNGAEYFIDTDPGFGNGTPITLTSGNEVSNIIAAINTTGLSRGVHRVFIRSKNASGTWSIVQLGEFVVDSDPQYPASPAAATNIIAAEYFINTDPGVGNATAIAITAATDINSLLASINTSSLIPGTYEIFLRTKNANGFWSITSRARFVVEIVSDPLYPDAPPALQNISAAEYFINTDPGFGNGTPITVSAATQLANINVAVNTNGLTPGTYKLVVRTKSTDGKWSIGNVREFVVEIANDPAYPSAPAASANIIAAEYFIDTDPGNGNATPVTITAGSDVASVNVTVNTNGLSLGKHMFALRTRDAAGIWSIRNIQSFVVGTLTVQPDTVRFGDVPVTTNSIRNISITNNSAVTQTINSISIGGAFTSTAVAPLSINSGQTITIPVSFTPVAVLPYQNRITLETTAGQYVVELTGTGLGVINAWTIEPPTGRNYGAIEVNTNSTYNFTLRNTGNVAITLQSVSSSNAAFTPTYTAGINIAAGATISIPVQFRPTAVGAYSSVLKVKAATGGPDSVTTTLTGTGYISAIPPVLRFVQAAPYLGTAGVNPPAGQTGTYTYKVVYSSADNNAPAANQPQIGIDLNGDQDFDDAGEGIFSMTKEGSSTDYVTGVVYSYTANYNSYSNTMGYRFFAKDALGNQATTVNSNYIAGPVVTFQLLDLKLFANDISFSKANPSPGESFVVTAKITNNSAFASSNVPVYFYRDTIVLDSTIIPTVSAFSISTVTKTMSFASDGFYPIKVWADPNHVLNETNILNNYAIRPVIVGKPILPGGITVTAAAQLQNCPLRLVISGNAVYFGTSIATNVAGAEVTINTGTGLYTTTTDANGNYRLVIENPACGGTLQYTVSVTDFTFTSSLFTGAIAIACPPPNICVPPPATGGIIASFVSTGNPCANTVGNTVQANITVTYRSRDLSNFWNGQDRIFKDTIKVFLDGVLIDTYFSYEDPIFGATAGPGDMKTIPVNVPLSSAGTHVVTVVHNYVYNEFFQIESTFYRGEMKPMNSTTTTSVFVAPNLPDLTIGNFRQTGFRTFTFDDINNNCADAGSHVVRVLDVTGAPQLLQEITVASLLKRTNRTIVYSGPTLSVGTHRIRIVTDTLGTVTEELENNNVFEVTIVVPATDISVTKVEPAATALAVGTQVRFRATLKNTGIACGAFAVRFAVGATTIGNTIAVTGMGENAEIIVTSDVYTVTTADKDCPVDITVTADVNNAITESTKANNSKQIKLGSDVTPVQLPGEFGSAGNPSRVRVNQSKTFNAYIRNIGNRDISNVPVMFVYNNVKIGETIIPNIKAGEQFPAVATFTYTFNSVGTTTVRVVIDSANLICEADETNNRNNFHVLVTDVKEDLEVLSQYISPTALNPNPGQQISLVGTVKNVGNRTSAASVLRFYVDNIQLGNDIPFNALLPGQDTTVAASAQYSSLIAGVKIMKIVADPQNVVSEENETNNEATRAMIVGDAPDMAVMGLRPLRFNPSGFSAGDSVLVSLAVQNKGAQPGSAWVRYTILDAGDAVVAIDSVFFSLNNGANMQISKKLLFDESNGTVIAEIVNVSPTEFDLLNNTATLPFSTIGNATSNLTVNGNLDMRMALPDDVPGWIGGKLLLGDFDLTVNGDILNADTAHFIVTNGIGRLRINNNKASNVFPVGTSIGSSNFVKITNAGVQDNFNVRVLPYVLRNGTSGDTIINGSVNRTWLIEEQVPGGSNATIEMFWFAPHELSGFDRSQSRTAHYTAATWQFGNVSAAGTDSVIGRYSKSQAGFNSFSPFTVTNGFGGGLPVTWLSFKASLLNGESHLQWTTANEINNSHFVVEHSRNGQVFATLQQVNAAGNSTVPRTYSYVHQQPAEGANYYRIKQVDRNGSFTYSVVQMVQMQPSALVASIVPNPVAGKLTLRLSKAYSKPVLYSIVSTSGATLIQGSMAAGANQLSLQVAHLPQGMYRLVLLAPEERRTLNFLKQ